MGAKARVEVDVPSTILHAKRNRQHCVFHTATFPHMTNRLNTNGPSFRSIQEPLPLDNAEDGNQFSRIRTPETATDFRSLEQELHGSIKRIDQRYKQIIMDLRRRQAPQEDIAQVEEEKRELIEHRKEEFRKKLGAFINELMGDKP